MGAGAEQKVAVVTGAGHGLGQAIALAFAHEGYRVAILGRTVAKLEKTNELAGGKLLAIGVDVADRASVRKAFKTIDERFGRIDVLVNNAASHRPFAFETASEADIQAALGSNLMSVLYCTQEAIPRMKAVGGGDIVSLSSESAPEPFPYIVLYGASKAAVEAFTHGLRLELRGTNIRPIVFRSGIIEIDEMPDLSNPIMPAFMEGMLSIGVPTRGGVGAIKPESMANAIVYAVQSPRDSVMELVTFRHAYKAPPK